MDFSDYKGQNETASSLQFMFSITKQWKKTGAKVIPLNMKCYQLCVNTHGRTKNIYKGKKKKKRRGRSNLSPDSTIKGNRGRHRRNMGRMQDRLNFRNMNNRVQLMTLTMGYGPTNLGANLRAGTQSGRSLVESQTYWPQTYLGATHPPAMVHSDFSVSIRQDQLLGKRKPCNPVHVK